MNSKDIQQSTRDSRPLGHSSIRTCLKASAFTLLIAFLCFVLLALQRAKLKAPEASLLLLDRHGQFLAQAGERDEQGYGYWPIQRLPERVVAATLALEDQRFWRHPGIDPFAIARAAWQNIVSSRHVSGASTIAMQVVRMQNPGPRTYLRKAVEALTALFMTLRYGREEVLKHYMRLVPYGNRCHGIAYASRLYLDKPVSDLSWAEIAFLSAIPQAPSLMNPFTPRGRLRAIKRGRRIMRTLHEKGLIPKEDYSLAISQLNSVQIPERQSRHVSTLHAILKLEALLKGDASWKSRYREPRIITTLDIELQETVERFAHQSMRQWEHAGAGNVAVIVTRRKSREVLAWLGSSDYFSPEAGSIDFTTVRRSPGSTLKPFIYALALERGHITPGTILDDLESVSVGIDNADRSFLGPLLPRQALANSRNVPAVNVLKAIGIDEAYYLFHVLGLHGSEHPSRYYGLCMALGCMPTSLERLVRAYGILANDGILQDLIWYKKQALKPRVRILSENSARLITLFLSDPMARLPAFPRMGSMEYPFPVALKTGTSQGYRDAWALAYSRDYLVGVWVGRADWKSMNNLGGVGSAAFLAKKIMLHLHPHQTDGMADLSFPPPEGYHPVEVCTYTGQRATAVCESTLTEWFPADQVPNESDGYRIVPIDTRNGLRATAWTPKDMVEERSFINLPSRYDAWAAVNKIPLPPAVFSPLDMPVEDSSLASVWPLDGKPYTLRGEKNVDLTITSPENGLKLLHNPETPAALNSLALRVIVDPGVPQVVWYVDGRPFKLVGAPYAVRWPLQQGNHTFQVRLPFRDEASGIMQVTVE